MSEDCPGRRLLFCQLLRAEHSFFDCADVFHRSWRGKELAVSPPGLLAIESGQRCRDQRQPLPQDRCLASRSMVIALGSHAMAISHCHSSMSMLKKKSIFTLFPVMEKWGRKHELPNAGRASWKTAGPSLVPRASESPVSRKILVRLTPPPHKNMHIKKEHRFPGEFFMTQRPGV